MDNVRNRSTTLRGLSFSIADLILIGSWSEAYGLRMAVRLDHGSDAEEFEEVLTFEAESGQPCRFIMWCDREAVYLQPLIGRPRRFASAVDAIAGVTPRDTVVLTDVVAPSWPRAR